MRSEYSFHMPERLIAKFFSNSFSLYICYIYLYICYIIYLLSTMCTYIYSKVLITTNAVLFTQVL